MPNPVIAWVKHNIPRKSSSRADTNASNGFVRNASNGKELPKPKRRKRRPGKKGDNRQTMATGTCTLEFSEEGSIHGFGQTFELDLLLKQDPEAEVIALSPKTLLATNRFLCEICGKGFQRDQNLQALGDLTGIKKHFCRKHGEKKWKCDKCSKRYAVQSDWKAHMKTCGTREYRCDCGTLFSRRDSFITHRAFCDALAEETARLCAASSSVSCVTTAANGGAVSCQLPGGSMRSTGQGFSNATAFSDLQSLGANFFGDSFPTRANPHQLDYQLSCIYGNKAGPSPTSETAISHHLLASVPSLYSTQHQQPSAPPPDMSATALLQKAAQIGIAPIEPPFLWSLYSKSGGGGIQVEDSNKFENLFSLNPTGLSDIPVLNQLQGFSTEHPLPQKDELGGQTRDFLGVNVQAGKVKETEFGWNPRVQGEINELRDLSSVHIPRNHKRRCFRHMVLSLWQRNYAEPTIILLMWVPCMDV
ncbi:unnamed protein product [Spirodela intermedia]|uniref:Uncharacterized protein n=1 Tax=Spirodela intermedia TaxID=51605 RepID=A0A7I8ISU0_SPIIN|nr:unnamed protein product [Spirodela intermedia]CAA6661081.1 unnamed protein product [Spirodela intermedia]